ncbi:MAG: ABC transporter ATP-binding protein [Anaerolineales bacterium]|jgi:NitT/TauT family transport system ATP-binding protein
MKTSEPVLITRNLSMVYPHGDGDLPALHQVDLQVQPQEFVCIVGPSGCGKTTLLRLLAGLLEPSSGEVLFEGQTLRGPRRRIGFVFQQTSLMPWRSVMENISLPLELQGVAEDERRSRSMELIELVGLGEFENTHPHNLSGGMAQRVAIARALVHEPNMLLLDEPFGALDALTRERMASELLRIWTARTVTVVMVTHSISEALLLSDRLLVLSDRPGRVRLEMPVPLPRPRSLEMTYTLRFGEMAQEVRAAIG